MAKVLERLHVNEADLQQLRSVSVPATSTLVVRSAGGEEQAIGPRIQKLIFDALQSIAANGSVRIEQVPDELTTTTAAHMLGVSRPTLMKWIAAGDLPSFKRGSHTRLLREDIQEFLMERETAQSEQLHALREFDEQHADLLGP